MAVPDAAVVVEVVVESEFPATALVVVVDEEDPPLDPEEPEPPGSEYAPVVDVAEDPTVL